MKKSIKEFSKLANVNYLSTLEVTKVIDILVYNHELETALGSTELPMKEWLKELTDLEHNDMCSHLEMMCYLHTFRGETERYLESMSLQDAVHNTIVGWINK